MKLRLHVWILPLPGGAPASKVSPFLLLSAPECSLDQLSAQIVAQYQRNYPQKP